MHYTQGSSTPQYSYASAKVPVPSQSQATSPAWSERSINVNSSTTPTAPYMTSVPLPQGASMTPAHPNPYGPMTHTTGPPPILHPILTYNSSSLITCNISQRVTQIQLHSTYSFNEPAVQSHPSTSRMILNIKGFPQWFIEVVNPYGVTVGDVLARICETMNYSVSNTEFNTFGNGMRTLASNSFAQRQNDQNALTQGVQRSDCMERKLFVGLQASVNSYSWDVCLV